MSQLTTRAVLQMAAFYKGNHHDVAHFMKVWGYARTIAAEEGLEPALAQLTELAAICHDIAIPLCREKYGDAAGPLQEAEGPALALAFLDKLGVDPAVAQRIAFVVGHHHTVTGVDGIDWQILLEADFLVNADEGAAFPEAIASCREKVFRTKTGLALLDSIYPPSR